MTTDPFPTERAPAPFTVETITLGPVELFFCNSNTEMKLAGHCHHARLHVTYRTLGSTGYPSFKVTNDGLRERIRELTGTDHPFRDATNEVVLRRLWRALDGWHHPSWEQWGGVYQLNRLDLDVLAALDRIGHDAGTTRYTITRAL